VKPTLTIEKTARLVARSLGITPEALAEGLRPSVPADLPAVLALRRQVLADQLTWDDATYLRWRYGFGEDGPALAACWVCERNGELLGVIGIETLEVRAGQLQRPVHAVMDLMVRPDLDGSGLGVWINQAVCQRLGCVLAIGSNPNSKGVVARTFDALPDRRSHTHPLHFDHFMAKRLSPKWLAQGVAALADAAMTLARIGRLWLPAWSTRVTRVTGEDDLGAHVASLLQRALRDDRVEILRSVERLRHRLMRNPRSRVDIWLAWRGERVTGLLATRRTAIEEGRLALQLMDLVLAPGDERAALRALLARATAHGYRLGADYLTATLYDPPLEGQLQSLFFRRQANEYETLAWHCTDPAFREAVLARKGWSLCDLHTDRDQG
jgi:hypothetical protein